ncbi:hypothetical protein [Agaribacterium sp. ZY112]|uniref:hypothetical protein n=1 Tax=Agaribacterium sp. ZY112 TaxID=3233574 RepID=UPI0035256D6E
MLKKLPAMSSRPKASSSGCAEENGSYLELPLTKGGIVLERGLGFTHVDREIQ